jgi:hypothetical protein
MDIRCVLCNQPTKVRVIGALVVMGDRDHPDAGVLCRPCAALSAEERKTLRDQAMARMLDERETPMRSGT